ncbi:hypothetical protein CEXT_533881 [Caerostris extrusa]|uniref:Uncharacterized protein n=1 Tax=Caerostris extrusa TaxID=172846 RepID=A0AAV4N1R0_CAEEX|nr:hypothetical protein CEXT_533881 [Caerostris extrusa]
MPTSAGVTAFVCPLIYNLKTPLAEEGSLWGEGGINARKVEGGSKKRLGQSKSVLPEDPWPPVTCTTFCPQRSPHSLSPVMQECNVPITGLIPAMHGWLRAQFQALTSGENINSLETKFDSACWNLVMSSRNLLVEKCLTCEVTDPLITHALGMCAMFLAYFYCAFKEREISEV